MKTIGNLLWFFFTGLGSALAFFSLGITWCITIIGIPFGLQLFKLGRLFLWPFGAQVHENFGKHPIANVIWILLGGIGLAVYFLMLGVAWCVTIIGIPFGLQCFKFAKLSLFPFGAEIKS